MLYNALHPEGNTANHQSLLGSSLLGPQAVLMVPYADVYAALRAFVVYPTSSLALNLVYSLCHYPLNCRCIGEELLEFGYYRWPHLFNFFNNGFGFVVSLYNC